MRKLALFVVLFMILMCDGIRAQTFSLVTGREPVASLDGLWRFHTGDNPAWASPNFDDSHWPLLRSDEEWAGQGYKDYSGYAWYRFRLDIPAGLDQISLLLPPMMTSYQVYVNGKLCGSFSQMPPHDVIRLPRQATYAFTLEKASTPREATVALRIWHWQGWSSYRGGGPQSGGALVGQSSLIDARFQMLRDSLLLRSGATYSLGILCAISGTIALLLFLTRRSETEYLWFAVNQLAWAAAMGLSVYETVHPIPLFSRDWASNLLDLIGGLGFVFFLQKLLRGRRSALYYLAILGICAKTALYIILMLVPGFGVANANLGDAIGSLVIFAWSCDLLVRRAKEGLPDARLLLAPVLIALGLDSATEMLWGAFQHGWLKANIQLLIFKDPFPLPASTLVEILFLIAMLAILSNRFMRSRREELRLAGEFEAARSVQSLLVPATAPSTPGFAVESVYIPASEVGGDFFHVSPDDDGSLLIVVGDVSGKGLKAAMTVSTIMGALRNEKERQPALVLRNLNRVLHGRISGFATCAAARIAAGGIVTIANAGHLSPYRNGEELAVDPGLPLGIGDKAAYAEVTCRLSPNDRLTFVSDGVVEARNVTGELYGFERTRTLSTQPAQVIAETARDFGQEDDITVLTLTPTANLGVAIA
ncbi:MAG: SpoIIE family protein phosphatase [Acidobacteriota bacterium]|nr:SpoIIE family protein phosphatase [Acidobacteriota bacterium]